MAHLDFDRRSLLSGGSASLLAATLMGCGGGSTSAPVSTPSGTATPPPTPGTPAPSVTAVRMSVGADRMQRFDGLGLSQPPDPSFEALDPQYQAKIVDFVYGSLPVDYFRTWLVTSAGWDVPQMIARFRQTYLDNRLLSQISTRCQPKLILAPATGGEGLLTEPSEYANRVAEVIAILQAENNLIFDATGIANEPGADAASTKWIATAASSLRRELDGRNLSNTKIIAADWANVGTDAIDAINQFQSDPEANAAIHAWANHSYNMCSTSEMAVAARNKERWVTEAGQCVNDSYGTADQINMMDAANLAGRFLTDMNNGVTRWMYFIGLQSTEAKKNPANPWTALALISPSGDITAFNRFHYLKELTSTFARGSVFHRCDSSLDGTMDWTYGQKPRLSAACAEGTDGRLRIAIVNTTGIIGDAISKYYPSEAFQIELDLPWQGKSFQGFILGTDATTRSLGDVRFGASQSAPFLHPNEMLILVEA